MLVTVHTHQAQTKRMRLGKAETEERERDRMPVFSTNVLKIRGAAQHDAVSGHDQRFARLLIASAASRTWRMFGTDVGW